MPNIRSGGFGKERNVSCVGSRTPDRLACSTHLTKVRLAGTELFRACGRTDRHGEAFYNFPNWPKTDH
jgi:hypothetical protein